MSTKDLQQPPRTVTPYRTHLEQPLEPPNLPSSSRDRDQLTKKELRWEEALDELDKQLDYEDIHGPGTSQHAGAWWRRIPDSPKHDAVLQSTDVQDSVEHRNSLLRDREKHVMEEVQRDLNYTARSLEFTEVSSESSESAAEEAPSDVSPLVGIKHGGNVKGSDKKLDKSKELKKNARRVAKAKERQEGRDKSVQEVTDERCRRTDVLSRAGELPGNFPGKKPEMGLWTKYDEELNRNKVAMRKSPPGLQSEDANADKVNDKDMYAGAGSGSPIRSYDGGGRQSRHDEPENPQSRAEHLQTQTEDGKLSDKSRGKSKSKSESEDRAAGENAGAGAGAQLNIDPYADERRFFHEAETPQTPWEELRGQNESPQPFIHELYRLKPSKDPAFVSKEAARIRNAPFWFSDIVVNDPYSKNDLDVIWSWKRIVIIVVMGILLADLVVRVIKAI